MAGDAADEEATVDTAICFDLDGTLLAYDRAYAAVVRETLETEYEVVTDEMVDAFLETFAATRDAVAPEPYRAGMAVTGNVADAPPAEGVIDALVTTLLDAEKRATAVPEAARDCVATLAADEGVAVCVVADGLLDWQREKLAHHGLADDVATVVTTDGAGGPKASGAPYDAVREVVDADEFVMIGDDYADDVEAARAAGFVPIHYEDDEGPDFFGTLHALL